MEWKKYGLFEAWKRAVLLCVSKSNNDVSSQQKMSDRANVNE
jgi:hypothetical protein